MTESFTSNSDVRDFDKFRGIAAFVLSAGLLCFSKHRVILFFEGAGRDFDSYRTSVTWHCQNVLFISVGSTKVIWQSYWLRGRCGKSRLKLRVTVPRLLAAAGVAATSYISKPLD